MRKAPDKTDNLERYRAKRNFSKTAEPDGRHAKSEDFVFIIQKHEASHLHYDFRLQFDGTLKSWAVPKGPSYDPHDKRLAMQVEDHPVEYATFEGTIPQGEYGGGTVMLWDRGTWEPVGDPRAGLIAGKLVFILHGERMQGEWTLVRTHGKSAKTTRGKDEPARQWLLIKHRDEFVREGDAGKLVAENITSIATGRTMVEISNAARKEPAADETERPHATRARARKAVDKSSVPPKSRVASAVKKLPEFIPPQLATLCDAMPQGADWVHEVKFDGYRMLAYVENGAAHMLSRNNKNWTKSFPELAEHLAQFPVTNAIIDGEVVRLDGKNRSDFSALKNALADGQSESLYYVVFDLLYIDGVDIRAKPLRERKAQLASLLGKAPAAAKTAIQLSAEFADDAGKFFKSVSRMGLEGVISKRADAPYSSGRGTTWLKIKCTKREEFVIGGYTLPANGSDGIGALLLGYFDGDVFTYAGRVGTGWNHATAVSLRRELEKLTRAKSPFATIDSAAKHGAQWLRPKLVCEVQFAEWTPDGHLRHPSFQGLREDKPAHDVKRDYPVPVAKATASTADSNTSTAAKQRNARPVAATSVNAAKLQKTSTSKRAKPPALVTQPKKISNAETHLPVQPKKSSTALKHSSSAATVPKKSGSSSTVADILISHPDRIIFPESRITKLRLAQYYESVAEMILPHITRRPISVLRCPSGAGDTCFFQRHLGVGKSPHLHELSVPIKGADVEYLMIENIQGLLALVQWGVIEIHPWQCTANKLDKPDRMIFDLDPGPNVAWDAVMAGAREVQARMAELKLSSFVKTTGGKGLHVVVPMAPVYGWDAIKSFTRMVAQSMAADSPKKYVSTMTKTARTGRIYIDYLRNENTATAVAPFSARARSGAPISRTLAWSDLKADLDPAAFTVEATTGGKRRFNSDPWAEFFTLKQRISKKHLQALRIDV